ncbi:hypothetical protein BAK_B0102 (plasmid) [Bacillus anthracis str. A0389]|nr:hypothetical protein BAMEG_B0072 [Bacillus anthracis str. CDC 684]EDR85104.1 hypothetical protein BAQ_B0034 [Bacillus anthracis str. A0193]EDS94289.1 hypothetical protein BAK_B0102 [Bacillus anthracis str. A0389]
MLNVRLYQSGKKLRQLKRNPSRSFGKECIHNGCTFFATKKQLD